MSDTVISVRRSSLRPLESFDHRGKLELDGCYQRPYSVVVIVCVSIFEDDPLHRLWGVVDEEPSSFDKELRYSLSLVQGLVTVKRLRGCLTNLDGRDKPCIFDFYGL